MRWVVATGLLVGISTAPTGSQELCSCGHPCDVVLDNTVLSGDETIEACLTITAGDNVAIEPPAAVLFRAGQSVTLGPSFYVTADPLTAFTVQIDEALFCDETADADLDSWNACLDCDDDEPSVHPTATEVCNGLDDDCDGVPDDGIVLNTNPACVGAADVGELDGDLPGAPLPAVVENGERWLRFTLKEGSDDLNDDLTATITLASPAGVDYDLFVYCAACGGLQSGSSTLGPGLTDTVHIRVDDPPLGGADNTVDLLVEVRYVSGTSCASWTLVVDGDTGAGGLAVPNCG